MKTRILLSGFLLCAIGSFCAASDVKPEAGLSQKFVGEQLRSFKLEPDGALAATRDAWINLYHTEGVPFRLSGKVWLGGRSKTLEFSRDLPDGFALFLREWDSLHRYSLTSRSLVVKRRLVEGVKEKKIATVEKFEESAAGQWIPFTVEATPERITFQFGQYASQIIGPLDMDGANKIALAPGTKIKDVQLEILEASPKPVSPTAEAVPGPGSPKITSNSAVSVVPLVAPSALAAEAGGSGKVALSFRTIPGQTYHLQFKNDLTDLAWTPMGDAVKATGSTLVIHDDATQPRRFYTVVVEP